MIALSIRAMIAAAMLLAIPMVSSAEPILTVSADRDTIRVGDPIMLTMTLVSSTEETARFPDFPAGDDGDGLELLEMTPVETIIVDGVRTETLRLSVTCYEVGNFSVPSFIPVDGGEGTEPIPIAVISVGLGEDLRAPKNPAAPPRNWWLTIWPYLASAVIAGLITWLIRRRTQRGIIPDPVLSNIDLRPAHTIAIEAVDAVEGDWNQAAGDDPRRRQCFFHISLVLREYIRNRYAFPAPERTTREILRGIRQETLPGDATGQLRDLLDRCDLIKFRGDFPDETAFHTVIKVSREFIDNTRAGRKSDVTEGAA